MDINEYNERIRQRSFPKFIIGIITRLPKYLKFNYSYLRLKLRGVNIGKYSTVHPSSIVHRNVTIGNNTSVSRNLIITNRTRQVIIGNHVIIGDGVKILLESHNIDSPNWENIRSPHPLEIGDYVWICPYSTILPGVKRIGKGAVIGSGSVVAKDVDDYEVVGGNPAKVLKNRCQLHTNLITDTLLGNDLIRYVKAWIIR